MSRSRYTEEFKEEAVKQITERGYSVSEISKRIGVSTNSLYKWLKQARGNKGRHGNDHEAELLRLKNELKRVQEERDILKKAAAYFAKESE